MKFKILIWAIAIQALIIGGTIIVTVFVPKEKEVVAFKAAKKVYAPKKDIEESQMINDFQALSGSSASPDRFQLDSVLDFNLPSLPDIPVADFSVRDTNTLDSAADMSVLLSAGNLFDSVGQLGSQASEVSFMGINEKAERIFIVFDTSRSVLNKSKQSGKPMEQIRDEAIKLVEALNANTLFGLVQFVRKFDLFQNYLVPGTKRNKAVAKGWLNDEFNFSGNSRSSWNVYGGDQPFDGVQGVLKKIFEFKPDVVFLISDAGFGRNLPSRKNNIDLDELARDLEALQQQVGNRKTRIHFIGFQLKDTRKASLKKIIAKYGGVFKEFE